MLRPKIVYTLSKILDIWDKQSKEKFSLYVSKAFIWAEGGEISIKHLWQESHLRKLLNEGSLTEKSFRVVLDNDVDNDAGIWYFNENNVSFCLILSLNIFFSSQKIKKVQNQQKVLCQLFLYWKFKTDQLFVSKQEKKCENRRRRRVLSKVLRRPVWQDWAILGRFRWQILLQK